MDLGADVRVRELLATPASPLTQALEAFAGGLGGRYLDFGGAREAGPTPLADALLERWTLPANAAGGFDVVDPAAFEAMVRGHGTRPGYDDLGDDTPDTFVIPVDPVEHVSGLTGADVQQARRRRGSMFAVPAAREPSAPWTLFETPRAEPMERWRPSGAKALSPYPRSMGRAGQIDASLLRFPEARASVVQGERRAVLVEQGPSPSWAPASVIAPAARAAERLADDLTARSEPEAAAPARVWLVAPAAGGTAPATKPKAGTTRRPGRWERHIDALLAAIAGPAERRAGAPGAVADAASTLGGQFEASRVLRAPARETTAARASTREPTATLDAALDVADTVLVEPSPIEAPAPAAAREQPLVSRTRAPSLFGLAAQPTVRPASPGAPRASTLPGGSARALDATRELSRAPAPAMMAGRRLADAASPAPSAGTVTRPFLPATAALIVPAGIVAAAASMSASAERALHRATASHAPSVLAAPSASGTRPAVGTRPDGAGPARPARAGSSLPTRAWWQTPDATRDASLAAESGLDEAAFVAPTPLEAFAARIGLPNSAAATRASAARPGLFGAQPTAAASLSPAARRPAGVHAPATARGQAVATPTSSAPSALPGVGRAAPAGLGRSAAFLASIHGTAAPARVPASALGRAFLPGAAPSVAGGLGAPAEGGRPSTRFVAQAVAEAFAAGATSPLLAGLRPMISGLGAAAEVPALARLLAFVGDREAAMGASVAAAPRASRVVDDATAGDLVQPVAVVAPTAEASGAAASPRPTRRTGQVTPGLFTAPPPTISGDASSRTAAPRAFGAPIASAPGARPLAPAPESALEAFLVRIGLAPAPAARAPRLEAPRKGAGARHASPRLDDGIALPATVPTASAPSQTPWERVSTIGFDERALSGGLRAAMWAAERLERAIGTATPSLPIANDGGVVDAVGSLVAPAETTSTAVPLTAAGERRAPRRSASPGRTAASLDRLLERGVAPARQGAPRSTAVIRAIDGRPGLSVRLEIVDGAVRRVQVPIGGVAPTGGRPGSPTAAAAPPVGRATTVEVFLDAVERRAARPAEVGATATDEPAGTLVAPAALLGRTAVEGDAAAAARPPRLAPALFDALRAAAPIGERPSSRLPERLAALFEVVAAASAAESTVAVAPGAPGEVVAASPPAAAESTVRRERAMVVPDNVERALVAFDKASTKQAELGGMAPRPRAPAPARDEVGSLVSGAAPLTPAAQAAALAGKLFGDRGPMIVPPPGAERTGRVLVETGARAAEVALRSTPGQRPGRKAETNEEARHRLASGQVDDNLSPEEVDEIAREVIALLKRELELEAARSGGDEWD